MTLQIKSLWEKKLTKLIMVKTHYIKIFVLQFGICNRQIKTCFYNLCSKTRIHLMTNFEKLRNN